ncbi:MAG: phosphatidate cytidylyltransferase [Crocinitomicaceae bacterium]|nr:phosphatidate cytidylyltransferase [Crocinitomicaceae bacterium]
MIFFGYHIPIEVIYVLAIIFSILTICSVIFQILYYKKETTLLKELITRIHSWWKITIGIAIIITAPPIIGTILLAFISFVALREMFSIGRIRSADRVALFVGYFAVPVQYYLAYNNFYEVFLYFIPLIMFISIPVILVLTGKTKMIGRSMSIIPAMLMLTVYMLSYIALLFNIESTNFSAGPGGLIIFLIMLTSFNDVFQFTWGKLLGRHKILPNVSPNKTWEGFVGGIFSTAGLAYLIKFLTPLEGYQALIIGFIIGVIGFLGDSLISAIKRDLNIKDTDDLIPGHGGAMDRLDSIILTAPVFYHLLTYFIEH